MMAYWRSLTMRGDGPEMKIDTEVRHVTKPGANLFLQLGFSPQEAKRLHAASRKQINDTRLLKEQLMTALADWIEQHHLQTGRSRRDSHGVTPASLRCREPEDRQIHDRRLGRDVEPCGKTCAIGDWALANTATAGSFADGGRRGFPALRRARGRGRPPRARAACERPPGVVGADLPVRRN